MAGKNRPARPEHLVATRSKKSADTGDAGARTNISRNRLLFAAAIAATLGMTGYLLSRGSDRRDASGVAEKTGLVEKKEADGQNEIILGNVRFILAEPDRLSSVDRAELFQKMQSAYEKLRAYLGDDVMASQDKLDFKVIYDAGTRDVKSGVTWDMKMARLNGDGSVILRKKPSPDNLRIIGNEKIIAHEFVHLYAQPAGGVESLAFREGHAHAIAKHLYGTDDDDRDDYALADEPEVSRILDTGMDYTKVDAVLLKGGGSYKDLESVVKRKWAQAWGGLMEKDPLFMKNFYSEIARLKKSGVIDFSKQTYLDAAKKVSPIFEEWYRGNKCLKEIGETGTDAVLEAAKLPGNRILIANFQPEKRIMPGGRIYPPILSMPLSGRGRIEYRDAAGAARSYVLEREHFLFEVIKLPDEVCSGSGFKVMIGDTEIPLKEE